jgi:hypothetical protein
LLPFLDRYSPKSSEGQDQDVVGETTIVVGRSRIGMARWSGVVTAEATEAVLLLLFVVSEEEI